MSGAPRRPRAGEPELVLGPDRRRRPRGLAILVGALALAAGATLAWAEAPGPRGDMRSLAPLLRATLRPTPPTSAPVAELDDDTRADDAGDEGSAPAPYDLLERVTGDELEGFHEALARTAARRAGAVTRVLHLGDSSIGLDQLPHAVRTRFQQRFGDAGPGFVLLQPHSPSYRNLAMAPVVARDWDFCFIIFRCRADGHYGLGGVTVRSSGGSSTTFRLPRPPDRGTRTRFELWYAHQPGGGSLEVDVGGSRRRVPTESTRLEDARFTRRLPLGVERVRVAAAGDGPVRAYGVVVEHEAPGVVWDGLSMIGAFTHRLLAQDPAHLAAQVRWRAPDLVVLSYGGNDLRRLAAGKVTPRGLEDETRDVIRLVRKGRPGVSCVVMAINDHRRSGQLAVGPSEVEAVVGAQRLAARREGCAFFGTYRAMGGRGAFERWRDHRPPRVAMDGKHLTGVGRTLVAQRLYDALMRDHSRYRERRFASPGADPG